MASLPRTSAPPSASSPPSASDLPRKNAPPPDAPGAGPWLRVDPPCFRGPDALAYGALLVFILLLHASPALVVPTLDVLRPTQAFGVLAVGALICARMISGRGVRIPWPQGHAFLALILVAGLSTFTALWPRFALQKGLDLLRFMVVFFVIANVVEGRRRVRGLIVAFVVAGLFPALGGLTGIGVGETDAPGRIGWVGNFGNPNDLAFALVMLVPFALFLASDERVTARLLGVGALATFVAAIFFSYSRGGLIALLAVLGLLALRERRGWPMLVGMAGAAAAVVFLAAFWTRDQGFTDLASDPTVLQRIVTIKAGIAMWFDRPLLGVGPGCSLVAWPFYAPQGAEMSGGWLHNHNTFVQVLSETGGLGFLAFAVLIGASWLQCRRVERRAAAVGDRDLSALARATELSVWAFLACGLSGGLFLTWFPYLLAGLTCALSRVAPRPATSPGRETASGAESVAARAGEAGADEDADVENPAPSAAPLPAFR